MTKKLEQIPNSVAAQQNNVRLAINEALGRPVRACANCHHTQPEGFMAGEPMDIELSIEKAIGSVRLYYRHVNHAERYKTVEMKLTGERFRATIPANYTNSPYSLQYYFELREKPEKACLYPGFTANLTNQPYFVVHKI